MPKSDFISIRISPELKSRVEILFKEMGLTTSDAVSMFFAQVANRGEIPFTIKAKTPNSRTLAAMQECEDILSGKIDVPSMSVDQFFAEMGE